MGSLVGSVGLGSLVRDIGVIGWGHWDHWLGTLGPLVGSAGLRTLVAAIDVISWVCGVGAIGTALGHRVGPWGADVGSVASACRGRV